MVEEVLNAWFGVELEDPSHHGLAQLIYKLYSDWNQAINGRKEVIDLLNNGSIPLLIQVVQLKPISEKNQR